MNAENFGELRVNKALEGLYVFTLIIVVTFAIELTSEDISDELAKTQFVKTVYKKVAKSN